ncbi:hypothetical protein DER44DRAFT_739721 [Fusarium oxysporum]|nr:hypothetical protein DER44DRAFT_739721 [Fusarium oxysporum]
MQHILQNAHTIAKKHKVLSIQDMDDQIHFKMRSGTPTLLIVAPWSSEKTPIWEKAVQEMIGTWDWVRAEVHDCPQSFQATKDCLTLLALFHYGVIPDPKDNPLTIHILVDSDSDETGWHEVVADIKNMLQGVEGWGHIQIQANVAEAYASQSFYVIRCFGSGYRSLNRGLIVLSSIISPSEGKVGRLWHLALDPSQVLAYTIGTEGLVMAVYVVLPCFSFELSVGSTLPGS